MVDFSPERAVADALNNVPSTSQQLQQAVYDTIDKAKQLGRLKDDQIISKHRELWDALYGARPVGERFLWNEGTGPWSAGLTGVPNANGVLHRNRDTLHVFGDAGFNSMACTAYRGTPSWDSRVVSFRDSEMDQSTDWIIETSNLLRGQGVEFHPAFSVFRKYGSGIGDFPVADAENPDWYSAYETGFVDKFLEVFEDFLDQYYTYVDGICLDFTRHRSTGSQFLRADTATKYADFASTWSLGPVKWFMIPPGIVVNDHLGSVDLLTDQSWMANPANANRVTKFVANVARFWDFQALEVDRAIKGIHDIVRARSQTMPIRPYDVFIRDVGPGNFTSSFHRGRNSVWWAQQGWITGAFPQMYRVLWDGDIPNYTQQVIEGNADWHSVLPPEKLHPLMANYLDDPSREITTSQLDTVLGVYDQVATSGFDAIYIASLQTDALNAHLASGRYADRVRTPWG